ncbi:putative AP2-like ethylene-responsive transcription factor [Lupinus albus]|uniref:Putative AP2-like ethylene-responsive transcription factor n=1 Tax=Lupinus albus TaxID=3870 RepID=A0A6A4QIN9_LUPAL|nr:putative AP2-like ethylene-responsive transcription factor [Lupinus albus]
METHSGENDALRMLSQTRLISSLSSNELQRYGPYRPPGEFQMLNNFAHLHPPNFHFPSRGHIGSDLSLSMSDQQQQQQQQQWQSGPPTHYLATAAASSGFPPQIIRPSSQGWVQKNGFHNLMRPSS